MRPIVPNSQSTKIVRSLEEGWIYTPDWRWQVIESHLVRIGCSEDTDYELARILEEERDAFVRQALRLRYRGVCVNQAAIERAIRIKEGGDHPDLSARIKALVVADRFPEEIAEVLYLPTNVVVAFEKLFWDIRRYLHATLWLETVVRAVENQKSSVVFGEALWMRTAMDEGWEGLQRLWFRKRGTDSKAVDRLMREVEGMAARRVLRHYQHLEETGAPVSDDDVKRLVAVMGRGVTADVEEHSGKKLTEFFQRMLAIGNETLQATQPDSPKARALKEIMAERQALPTSPVRIFRRRMRVMDGR